MTVGGVIGITAGARLMENKWKGLEVTYYCNQCKEYFVTLHVLPNLNKTHDCGATARIVSYHPHF